jgi:hypothetical protein
LEWFSKKFSNIKLLISVKSSNGRTVFNLVKLVPISDFFTQYRIRKSFSQSLFLIILLKQYHLFPYLLVLKFDSTRPAIADNDLIGKRIQFFTDGHTTLNKMIIKCFAWYANIGIILDWYHLEKKCKEQLSMCMKGRDLRNAVLEQLLPLLWLGLTDRAIALLCEIGGADIKNRAAMEKLKEYLQRNTPYIPCYAIRKELSLRNSSNRGEKANDLIVSDRQKHNGMSWSKKGSVALAFLSALKRNNEYMRWFEKRVIEMKFAT